MHRPKTKNYITICRDAAVQTLKMNKSFVNISIYGYRTSMIEVFVKHLGTDHMRCGSPVSRLDLGHILNSTCVYLCDHMRTGLARFAEISLYRTGIPVKRAGIFSCDRASSPVRRANFIATAQACTIKFFVFIFLIEIIRFQFYMHLRFHK